MAEENKAGRPLKFKSAEELQKKIDEYFASCFEEWWIQDKSGKWHQQLDRYNEPIMVQRRPFTISGLAVHLDTSRQTLLNYEQRDEYFDTVTRAKVKIESYVEAQLFNPDARNGASLQFNLKNNFGWQDKSEVDSNIGNKDGKPFETKSAVAGLTLEELKALAQSKPNST